MLMILSSFSIFCQGQKVQEWQEHHPDVVFIEHNDFSDFSIEQAELLGDKIIVYNTTISMADISLYESAVKTNFAENTAVQIASDLEGSLDVKTWLAQNRTVKILKRSFFDSLSQERRDIYINANAMILFGENITLADIQAYNH
jgi:hypothetical protein